MYSGRCRRRSEVSKTPSEVLEAKQRRVRSLPTRSNFHMLTRAQCRRAESSACGVMRTSIRQLVGTALAAESSALGYAVPFAASTAMLRADVTVESLHLRQADCLPGRFGLV